MPHLSALDRVASRGAQKKAEAVSGECGDDAPIFCVGERKVGRVKRVVRAKLCVKSVSPKKRAALLSLQGCRGPRRSCHLLFL